MSDNRRKVKVEYRLREGDKRIKVRGKGPGSERNPVMTAPNVFETDHTLEPGKDEYISLSRRKDESTSPCEIKLPSTVHYEFTPGGKEKIEVKHEKGETTIKIPAGAPRWRLKLNEPVEAQADSIDTGSDDPVKVIEPPEEGEPPDKNLIAILEKEMLNTVLLHDFLDDMKKKNEQLGDEEKKRIIEDRKKIIEQALVLIDDAYVHLPLKKAMHAVEPVQRLKLLKHRYSQLDDRAFHNQMISIFTELRDLHTIYGLPDAYKGKIAFLPFLVEEFHEEEEGEQKRKYMVSKIFKAIKAEEEKDNLDASFAEGVIITHWNGVPIEEAIALNGERNAGSNEYARLARGLQRMTIRPLKMSLPPDEHWVDIDYRETENNQPCNRRFKWYVADIPQEGKGAYESGKDEVQTALGIDEETEMTSRVKKSLFKSEIQEKMDKLASWKETYLQWYDEKWDDKRKQDPFCAFSMVSVKNPDSEKFGYFRIYSFNVEDPDYFVKKFNREIKPQLEKEADKTYGLIIDVRGNGGGLITAGERLLQVLTREKIVPERFQFINSPLMLQLCQKEENERLGLDRWERSINNSIETGAVYSQGWPLEDDRTETEKTKKEKTEQRKKNYNGPIVLITDALCYSTTDIFAAGFQDNKIGKILGIHKKTGAGGANVWTHERLRKLLPADAPIKKLPRGSEFTVAIRRSTRVGENTGLPLEDLGVDVDDEYTYKMTKNDLLYCNVELIKRAAEILDEIRKEKEQEIPK